MKELYRKYRPKRLKDVIGQPEAVSVLREFFRDDEIPHVLLFTGPTGCGKTTLAHIVRRKLNCSNADFKKVNCSSDTGIDGVRNIESRMSLHPVGGDTKVWLLDECHMWSRNAQNAVLDILEETPEHVYFLLCTTDPHKLVKTIRSRSTEIVCTAMQPDDLQLLITKVAKQEKVKLSEDVVDRLIDVSDGSARKALVILNQVIKLKSEAKQLNAIQKSESKVQGIELARALLNPRVRWPPVAKIIKNIEEDPEKVRRIVLVYMSKVALGGGKQLPRVRMIITAFQDNYFDSGLSGLIRSCVEVIGAE